MNDFVAVWNHAADVWLGWIVPRACAAALAFAFVAVVVAVLQVRWLRVSAHLPSRLLLLPFLVLALPVERLLPPALGAPVPVVQPLPPAADAVLPAPRALEAAAPAVAAFDDAHVVAAPDGARAAFPGTRAWLLAGWALVAAGAVVHLVRRQCAAERALARDAIPVSTSLRRDVAHRARAAGIRRPVAVRAVHGLHSPLVAGVRRPVVHLPADLAAGPADRLAFALHHELEHVRRGDAACAWAVAVLARVFWFHPLVWLAAVLLHRWQELACDEAALFHVRGRRTDAADALFRLLERACGTTPPAPATPLLLSTRSFMNARLLRILDSRRSPTSRLSPGALAAGAFLALGALAVVRGQDDPARAPAAVTTAAATTAPLPDDVARALTQGAVWLLDHQQDDGRWAILPDPTFKNQRDHNEVCVTAMAVRALLPGLRSERLPIVKAVQRADMFLQQSQAVNGRFGPDEMPTRHQAHAEALRALCDVQREWPDAGRRACIERGVAYALAVRNPYMGWRYGIHDADNDSKITAAMLLALYAAKGLGVEIDAHVFDEATQLLDQLTDDKGRTGFVVRGQVMSRFTSKQARFPGELSEEPTAMMLLVRHAAGEDVAALHARSVELVAALPPEWDEVKGSIDLAYWQVGAETMAITGGDAAARWRQRLLDALLPHRIVEGDAAHWPAIDAWSHPGMEVYTTASAMLALRALGRGD